MGSVILDGSGQAEGSPRAEADALPGERPGSGHFTPRPLRRAAFGARGAGGGGRPIPPKLYRIGEIVDYGGVSRQTIHNYTVMGLLRESKWTGGGHRLYDESVFRRLDEIAELKARNKSLEEIREHFTAVDAAAGRGP